MRYFIFNFSDRCSLPIRDLQKLEALLATLFNKPQMLIIHEIDKEKTTITQIIKMLCFKEKIPEATLRFNAKKLYELGIITYGDKKNRGKNAEFTKLGEMLCSLLGNNLILAKQKFIKIKSNELM